MAPLLGMDCLVSTDMGGSRLGRGLRNVGETLLWFAAFIAAWQAFVVFGHISDLILPAPSDFLARIFTNFDRIYPQALSTLELIVVGFLFGAVPAVPLGLAIASSGIPGPSSVTLRLNQSPSRRSVALTFPPSEE